MYTETKPINIYDRDAVAAANAAAARSGTDEEVVEESTAAKLPETLEEATARLTAEFVDDVHEESKAAVLLQEAELVATPIAREEQIILDAAAPVLQAEFADMKRQVNDSLSELANLLLEHQRMIEQINERLEVHNQRSGHKI